MTTAELAKKLGGEVRGDQSLQLTGLAPAEVARPGEVTFAENDDYFARAEKSNASAILVSGQHNSAGKTLICVPNARVAFAQALALFFPEPATVPGVHPTAVIDPSAQVDRSAAIGPHCTVGERVRIGARVRLHGGNHVGADCSLGDETQLFPNVVLYPRTQVGQRVRIHAGTVIGSDGFGYVFHEGRHLKVPQIGNVIIQDDAEIGANVAIDRATLGSTIIGKGSRIDNLVQIGHNVVLGDHCILCGQAGIAGSTKLGSYVTMAGQAGLAGHLKIGNQVTIGAQGGVMNHIPDGETWLGTPAQPDRQMKRIFIGWQRLPELLQRVRQLEKRLAELDQPRP